MKKATCLWQIFVISCLLLGGLSSCGSDEPDTKTIDYYLEVEEEFLADGSVSHTDRYYNPRTLMMESIRRVYPTPDNVGNDDAVVKACDETYDRFYEMYTNKGEHLTCLLHLKKVHKVGDIVRESEELKVYNIDVNPIEPGE